MVQINMKKAAFLFLGLTIFTILLKAQSSVDIINRYKNDTTSFAVYPDAPLLDNLKPAIACSKMEINSWASVYRPKGDKRPHYDYKNISRYPHSQQKMADTVVLTKHDPTKSFAACWCPSFEPWYISAQTTDGRLLSIGDVPAMKSFLNKINDQFSAFLWFQLHDFHADIPEKTSHLTAYKKVNDGFLFSYNAILSTSPLTTAWLTYLVSTDFQIVLISTKHLLVNKKISYKI